MSTDLRLEILSTNSEQTELLGKKLGAALRGGEVLQLVSDLGGGKTTFAKGIVAGAGCDAIVSSPTFTISKEYQAPHLLLRHFDFYRLNDAGIVGLELQEGFGEPTVVTIIEWANIVEELLPDDAITINIDQTADTDRKFTITIPKSRNYITKVLQ